VTASIADSILHLHGWVALAVVFALPALESSAFVGFVFPGEIAVLLGGVLAFEGRVSLPAVMVAAVAGAVVGDTVGYAVGRRWGERLLRSTLGRVVKDEHLDRAKAYLAAKGGRAVFLGRFTAALRVMIPGLAGMSGLPYRSFAVANVAGGTLWAVGFVLLGYAAGESWRKVERLARSAGLLLLSAVVVVGAVLLLGRWVARHQDQVRGFFGRQRARPWVDRLVTRYERQLSFLARRLRPEGALGLSLTLGLLGIVAFSSVFGRIVASVSSSDQLPRVDADVQEYMAGHRTGALTTAMHLSSQLGGGVVLVPLVLVAGAGWWAWRRSPRVLVLLGAALAGSYALCQVVRALVDRKPPPGAPTVAALFSGSSFPSARGAQAVAVYGAVALLAGGTTRRWGRKVAALTAAGLAAILVGMSRVYLSASWLTDVLGGYALGALWLLVLLTSSRVLRRGRLQSGAGATAEEGEEGGKIAVAPRR